MDEPLPEDFDVIIIGTGLPESVLSGALSRISKSVLQLDINDYYGSNWASFNIKAFDELMCNGGSSYAQKDIEVENLLLENERFHKISHRQCIRFGESHCSLSEHTPAKETSINDEESKEFDEDTTQNPPSDGTSLQNVLHSGITEEFRRPESGETKDSASKNANKIEENEFENNSSGSPENDVMTATNNVVDDCKLEQGDVINPVHEVNIEAKPRIKGENTKAKLSPRDGFYDKWRRFNIDLTSKLMFSRGLLVEILIQSNVSRYLEFRSVSRLLSLLSGEEQLQPVPCSRADVFKSKFVSVIQKRLLMRVLTMCSNYEKHEEEYEAFKDKTFAEFLLSKKLSDKSQQFIIHSIAMVNNDTLTEDGLRATKKFLVSLGRYGNGAFLFPMYGVGEIPQAFSRLSAVFGGTFCLRRSAIGMIVDKETGQCKGIIDSTGQRISCRHIILSEGDIPDVFQKEFTCSLPRAVYVTDRPVGPSASDEISLISFPSTESRPSVRVVEISSPSCVCPQNYYLLHAQASQSNDIVKQPKEIFSSVKEILFSSKTLDKDHSTSLSPGDTEESDEQMKEESSKPSKPNLLWSAYFSMLSGGVIQDNLPQNMFIMNGPGADLGFDNAMEEARAIFEIICPEEEFLPRAPEPDEIIFMDEGYNTEKNGSTSDSQEEIEGEYADDDQDLQEQAASETHNNASQHSNNDESAILEEESIQ